MEKNSEEVLNMMNQIKQNKLLGDLDAFKNIVEEMENELESYHLIDNEHKMEYDLIEISKVKEIVFAYMQEVFNLTHK